VDRSDRITEALLGDSAYESIRAKRWGWFKGSIPKKLAIQSYLLFALAAVLPLTAALPPEIRRQYVAEVTSASPKIAIVALAATLVVTVSGLGVTGVGIRRFSLEPSLTEVQAEELFNMESALAMFGFLTGGLATVTTYAFVALGFGGMSALEAYAALGGGNPFAGTDAGVTFATVGAVALVAAVVLRFFSTYFYVEHLRTGIATY
jgi:hypothetical protein